MTRHFRTLLDLSPSELVETLERGIFFQQVRGTDAHPRPLEGKSIALVLEKASTRTRLSFDVGITELGGHCTVLMSRDTHLARGEPIADTAKMFSGFVHGVVYRTYGQERVDGLAANATVPVINALTDQTHPCQLLADLMTVRQEFGALNTVSVAWIGDGNNMAHSWIHAAALSGIALRIAAPAGYGPDASLVAEARSRGADVTIGQSPAEAVRGADVVTTDVWSSMGQEQEQAAREKAFAGFCVTTALMRAASDRAIFLHCLPAHRGEEVMAEVIDGPQSRVWVQAENRLHTQKALLELLCS